MARKERQEFGFKPPFYRGQPQNVYGGATVLSTVPSPTSESTGISLRQGTEVLSNVRWVRAIVRG